MEFLKSFELDLWWNKLIAVGLATMGAALAAKERDLIFVALGMIAIGFGELFNHKKSIEFRPPNVYEPGGILTSRPRFPTFLGIALDIIGAGFLVFGLYRLLTA